MILMWSLNQETTTKLDKRNTATSKKVDNDVMSANCDAIVFFPISGQFAAIRKQDSERMLYKSYIFRNSNLSSYKTWKQNQKISNTALILILSVKVLFLTKNADFFTKSGISKIKRVLVLRGIISKTKYVCVLTYQISSF